MAGPKTSAGATPPAPAEPDALEVAGAPVYDERGNVRPHGTPGARPMSYAERVAIANQLATETQEETS